MKQVTLKEVEEALDQMTKEDGPGAIGAMILSTMEQLEQRAIDKQKANNLPQTSVKAIETQIALQSGFLGYRGFWCKALKTKDGEIIPLPITKYIDANLKEGRLYVPKKELIINHKKNEEATDSD